MHTQSLLIRRLIALFVTLLVYYCSDPETFASSWPESVKQLDVGKISSIAQMKTAIDLLSMSSSQALKNNSFTPGLQELLLTKSGECISRLAALHEKMHHVSDKDKQEKKDSFLANREILKKIFDLNTEIIREIEEKRLDKMKDPSAFFKTPEWQQPQHLIFLSSYWVGWNGYYASLLFSEDDPLRKTLLDEAIKGFSWAFIDFQKDAFIVKSLFGRGLCYKQIKDYQNALNDFRSVRKKTNKDDSLYWRCRFEEALVTYQAGNLEQTSRDLDEMEKEMTRSKIPDNIVAGVKELKAQVLFTLSGKQAEPGQRETEKPDETFQQRTFSELKQLSVNNKSVVDELYQYAQKHAEHLDQLSYAELGPIAAMAMGDRYFAEKDYDKAIPYYLPISADAQSPFKHRLDVLWFRLAYCYCKQRQWGNALPYLENFRNKFPKSSLIQQALSLYYAAAFNIYNTHPTTGNYEKYIDSIQSYLNGCRTCPDRGEAHFQLGKYYQKKGHNDKALNEYLLVGKGAPNYPAARFLVLQSDVDTLESLRNKGQYRSKDAIALYHEAVRLLEECRTIDLARKGTAIQNEITPRMIIMQAKLQLLGPTEDGEKCLKTLDGFETRFPGEKSFFWEVTGLRMECFLRLDRPKQAEAEMDEYIKREALDTAGYVGLLEQANKYYENTCQLPSDALKGPSGRQSTIALIIYKKLSSIADRNPSFQKYGQTIQLRLAQICQYENNWPLAIDSYREILKKDPRASDVLEALGLLYEKTGQWGEAFNIWKKVSEGLETGTPAWFESRYKTAYALNRLGLNEKACAILTMTLALHPDLGDGLLKKKYHDLKTDVCNRRNSQAKTN